MLKKQVFNSPKPVKVFTANIQKEHFARKPFFSLLSLKGVSYENPDPSEFHIKL